MKVLQHVVTSEEDGRMIKGIIRAQMGVSHRQFSQLKARHGLLLDGASVLANQIVHTGQTVRVEMYDEEGGAAGEDETPVKVLYEDEDILVIDKDAPLACQSSPRQPENTLENRLMYRYREEAFVFRPINRLDKGTSGLMLAAKHAHAQLYMQKQLHTDNFIREYLAVVVGVPPQAEGEINAPIRKAEGATVRREVGEGGKPSRTLYRVEEVCEGVSLVRLRLLTGRTHQIRVHMASIGCPLLGDFLYGEEDERLKGRFALHSHFVRFVHPESGEVMSFTSPLPEELRALLAPSQRLSSR